MASSKQNNKNVKTKTAQKKQTVQPSVKEEQKKPVNTKVRNFFISVCLILFGMFYVLFLCTNLFGVVGEVFQKVTLGLFGIIGYLIPFVFIYAGIQLKANETLLKHRIIITVVFLVLLAALYNVIVFRAQIDEDITFNRKFTDLIQQLFSDGINIKSGGVIGGLVSEPLILLCANTGAGIILGVIIILMSFFVFRTAIARMAEKIPEVNLPVRSKDEKALQKEVTELRKEVAVLRRDENKKKKEEQKKRPQTESDVDDIIADIEKPYTVIPQNPPKTDEHRVVELIAPDSDPDSDLVVPPAESTDNTSSANKASLSEHNPLEESITDDSVRDMIFRKVSEAEAKEHSEECGEPPEQSDAESGEQIDGETGFEKEYVAPPIALLKYNPQLNLGLEENLHETAENLIEALKTFNVETKLLNITKGPTVTRFELQPQAGVKVSKVTNLSDDIALHLAAKAVRLEAPIPGKAAIGVEIPNKVNSIVYLEEIIRSNEFKNAASALSVALGKDIEGNMIIADLSRMPHLLIAGATGSGKSVCINSMLISLLYKSSPEDVKLILIDPKKVELSIYDSLPHLLIPVVTDARKASGALSWAVSEMEKRYELFKEKGVRDFSRYNQNITDGESKLPYIVIVIDEMADLMLVAKNEVEDSISRLAAMARAAGMHLVLATQRPSVNVITGTIKGNVPSRIAFAVASGTDSRIILDSTGAEKLLGKGDMLFDPMGAPKPLRVQGCYVEESEVESVVEFVKNNYSVQYDEDVINKIEQAAKVLAKGKDGGDKGGEDDDEDVMLPQAIEVVMREGMASTSTLQRKLKLGYARSARIMDQMEARGIIGPYNGSKPREVKMTQQQWLEMKSRRELE